VARLVAQSATTPAAFLNAVQEGCEGFLEWRAFSGEKDAPPAGRLFCQSGDDIVFAKFISDHREHHVYFGVATRNDDSSGKLENCRHLAALFVDIDFKVTAAIQARERLSRFPLPPSAEVNSGGGLHVYWFLREPLDLSDPQVCAEARHLLRRLAVALGGDLAAAEPARVLRVPGTLNCKPEYGAPRLVTVESLEPDRRYNPSDLDTVLPPEPATTTDGAAFMLPDRILAHEPGRNHTLWRYGRSLKAKGWKLPRILNALERVNRERCEPPLPEDELGDIAHNVMTEADRPAFSVRQNGGEPPPVIRTDRPEIDTANLGLDEMASAAWATIEAANVPPKIFLYGGTLAWLPVDDHQMVNIEVMNQDHVRHHLAEVATFIRWTQAARGRAAEKKPAFPPVALAADLLAVPRSTLPRLQRIVRAPIFTADGRLLTTPGYDEASGIYLAPTLTLPPIVEAPAASDIVDARELLCELLADFPFVTNADLAHTIALLLTLVLREMVSCVPMFVISKPTPRTGAGLLTKVLSMILTGSPVGAATISRDEDEMRKRLTAILLASPSMTLLDNLHGRLDSAALAAILTTPVWEDRLLGRSQTLRVEVRTVFVVTGNNVTLSKEITGRSVLVRLDPKLEDPSTRTGFRHPDLEAWVAEHRGRLLAAVLTLGQAWIAAGRPMGDVAFGGFQEWAAVLGGALKVAGVEGFLGNRQQLFDQADEESAHIRAFLSDWWQAHGDSPVLVKALIETAKGHPLQIASRTEQGQLIRLGQLIQSLEDRRYNLGERLIVTIKRAGEFRRAVLWRLACESDESCESSSVNAYGRARAQAREGESAEEHSQHSQTHMDGGQAWTL